MIASQNLGAGQCCQYWLHCRNEIIDISTVLCCFYKYPAVEYTHTAKVQENPKVQ